MSKFGIIEGITNGEYHADKSSFSSSLVKLMGLPAMAEHYINNPPEHKDCYRIGTAIHTYVLEPHLFDQQFFTGISVPRRGADNKSEWCEFFCGKGADGDSIIDLPAGDWYAEFEKQTSKSILVPDELQSIKDMAESVKKNKQAVELLTDGKPELSVYWTDEETGLDLRVRPDFLGEYCSDLKSVQSAKPQFFGKKVYDLGYHISQAMYLDGIFQVTGEYKDFKFICVEKTEPYLSAVYSLDSDSSEVGFHAYREFLAVLVECLDSGIWPGYPDSDFISMPRYAFSQEEVLGLSVEGKMI